MLSESDKRQKQADIESLRSWLAGKRDQPHVLPRRKAYDVMAVLFPTLLSGCRYHLSYLAMWLISKLPWSTLKIPLYRLMGVRIGRRVYIAPWVFLDGMYPHLIELGDGCILGGGCKLLTHENTVDRFRIGSVVVGANSVVGAFSIVRSGVSIGANASTAPGSVIMKDVPDNRVAIGNPARVVKPAPLKPSGE